jgi:phosphoesterase RecJ-like protein
MLTLKQKQIARQIWQEINQAQNILLHFHRSPDGDSVGSNMAMAQILQQIDKQASIVNADQVGEHFSAYLVTQNLINKSPCTIDLNKFDLHISLDSSSLSMVCSANEQIPDQLHQLKKIVIDHHISNTQYGSLNLVLPKALSTCEIIFELAKLWKVKINPAIASALLLGMVTDTGGFRWQGVGSATLRTAAELIDLGAELHQASWAAFRNIPFSVFKLWGVLIANMEYDSQRKAVITWVDYPTIKKLGQEVFQYDDTENVIANNIMGTDLGIVLKEKEPGKIDVSFRGRTGKVNVGEIATRLGGGGHRLAAGCPLKDLTIEEAKKLILQAVDQELARQNKNV